MSRILVISQLPPPVHGSTIMTQTLLKVLDELGHDWLLVDRRFSSSVAEVGKFRLRKVASAFWMPVRLFYALRRYKPDIVVSFATDRTFSFLVDWALSELLRRFRMRRINYIHTTGFSKLADRHPYLRWMVSRLLRSAHLTVHLGATLTWDIARWVDSERMAFIPNPVVDGPAEPIEPSKTLPTSVLYLSNLIPGKGADTFVHLAIDLAPEFPDAHFLVVGDTADRAYTQSLISKVEAAALSSRVRFLGAVTDGDTKWALLRDATVLVFPSTYDSFGMVLAEALASATPVCAYRVGALTPVIENAGAGFVVDSGDIESLENAVRHVLSDSRLALEQGRLGRALYEKEYTRERFRDRWRQVIEEQLRPQ